MRYIRQATRKDLARIAEIEIFNYRLNFYPIFQNDYFYFNELQVPHRMIQYEESLNNIWVYDDGTIKGFIQIENMELKKLFVEPILQGNAIGSKLLDFAVNKHHTDNLWALEKNLRALSFYQRHGFHMTGNKKAEEGTTEYLIELRRNSKV